MEPEQSLRVPASHDDDEAEGDAERVGQLLHVMEQSESRRLGVPTPPPPLPPPRAPLPALIIETAEEHEEAAPAPSSPATPWRRWAGTTLLSGFGRSAGALVTPRPRTPRPRTPQAAGASPRGWGGVWLKPADDEEEDPLLPCRSAACARAASLTARGAAVLAAVACSATLVFFAVAVLLSRVSEVCPNIPNGCARR
ncbi:hypothetical protein AB1Y20_005714 [Prymnesium parvum]|uniref:Uncharacterized protein n=1 Tax=Prymnesium parvum TaxID=97485 RepID=A0AB34J0I9_PRYPA